MPMANAKPRRKKAAAPKRKGAAGKAPNGSEYSLGKFGGGKVTDRGKRTK